ncbi:dTDP-glucose 4,6-dehydratase [Paenibacillus xerothermodurans]|uniref:dTDP-glucose 4,6-dehydratase n=1 Tax=Paenibacillus xerothermodurans TaxID=1977292 RepID=A0A2W1NYK9_PAEXE|nr:dTDP-glucose 4,6-dehydratase [Paenibacillus xerothermodurans]
MSGRTLLVTGGMGFIGSNFVRYWLERRPQDRVINLDALTYAGNTDNAAGLPDSANYHFVRGDITDQQQLKQLFTQELIHTVVNFAAESHVDRSIGDPGIFVRTNVLGTQCLLDQARVHGVMRFVHISTDEVYGTLGQEGKFTESTPLAPNSPYSASKAGSDLVARAYYETFGLPVIITRCSNNYGPYQYPEKLIPAVITRALQDEPVPVYGNGLNVRDWLHVEDHCSAIEAVIERGVPGEVYNIGGGNEQTNLQMVRRILAELGKPETVIQFVADRPGHDLRYAIDARKIERELGWQPSYQLAEGIRRTVEWYVSHRAWWNKSLVTQPQLGRPATGTASGAPNMPHNTSAVVDVQHAPATGQRQQPGSAHTASAPAMATADDILTRPAVSNRPIMMNGGDTP